MVVVRVLKEIMSHTKCNAMLVNKTPTDPGSRQDDCYHEGQYIISPQSAIQPGFSHIQPLAIPRPPALLPTVPLSFLPHAHKISHHTLTSSQQVSFRNSQNDTRPTILTPEECKSALHQLMAMTSTLVEVAHVEALTAQQNASGGDVRRIRAETERTEKVMAEAERALQETRRAEAETERVRRESDRVCRDIESAAHETLRPKVEMEKVGKEIERRVAETERLNVEAEVEAGRVKAEAERSVQETNGLGAGAVRVPGNGGGLWGQVGQPVQEETDATFGNDVAKSVGNIESLSLQLEGMWREKRMMDPNPWRAATETDKLQQHVDKVGGGCSKGGARDGAAQRHDGQGVDGGWERV
ncbi:hypothetical protein DFP73DRAFT_588809 [Morchella snyderi]|nr:hypothetical protein DFP73DRAFT_588809 [Morchella snyderi]